MSTAQALILAAYQKIGYYAATETMTAADSALGLQQLNMMLDQWSNEPQACFAITEQSFAIQTGKSQYSIGTSGGADVNATRPIRVIEGPGAAYVQDSNGNNFPVSVVTRQDWNQIGNRSGLTQSNLPTVLFYDPQMPLGLINLWPQPNSSGYTMYFDSYLQLADMASLTVNFSLPPGYEAAIQDCLAPRLWPFCFVGKPLPPYIEKDARTSLATVKRANKRNNKAQMDPELFPDRANGTYNIYSDSWSSSRG
ncbi:hypothetical protein ACFSHT_22445 [Paraburkholderia silviterrae]|uniref:Uncharacterized protein n=1 Tax=Paraburkholderia silviterrae TaxID=2528715 RepID=A0A4R5MF32_9BURK|nr:hypothetical protein [Paraburkholderia silviterrae]TDG25859.1 hypothetical protein EYW47_00365 [Paraburkholderia silviterrae]